MLIRESIEKTKSFFHKNLVNLKSFLFGGFQKLQKPTLLIPFSCGFGKTKNRQNDQYYVNFYSTWESDLEEAKNRRKNNGVIVSTRPTMNEENATSSGSSMSLAEKSTVKNKQEERKKEGKKMGSTRMDKSDDEFSENLNPEGYALAQKMKQLDLMDAGDVENVLDVEEALHYYSRLKSPVYVDIVDKFFVDMYSEFSAPQPSSKINSSKRRLGSIRL